MRSSDFELVLLDRCQEPMVNGDISALQRRAKSRRTGRVLKGRRCFLLAGGGADFSM
jgi:hypothetical protein